MNPDQAYEAEFEFKGQTLYPFSDGRLRTAFSIGVRMGGDSGEPTIGDIHAIIFICLSDPKTLAKSHRDPDGFWEKIDAWVDKNITKEDYEAEGLLVKQILEAAFSTKAEPLAQDDLTHGELLGN